MSVVAQDDLIPLLEPYNARLFGAIDRAWKRFNELPAMDRLVLMTRARTRANCIWEYIVREVHAEFDDDPTVQLSERNDSLIAILNNRVVARFKKLSRNGASRNFPTRRARRFNSQEELEGVPSTLPRVDVGYVENRFGNGYVRIEVSHRNGPDVEWHYEIFPEVAVIPLHGEPRESSDTPRIRKRGVAQLRIETINDGGGGDAK